MRLNLNTVKASDIFPVLGVVGGVVVSVKGAFTIGWELRLPRLYHQSERDYDSLIAAFSSACRVLPAWSMIHRQDLYTYEQYEPVPGRAKTYLEQCYERHFEGRRYLTGRSYLFLTIGNKSMLDKEGKYSGLFGIDGTCPIPSENEVEVFRAKAGEFIQILTSSGLLSARLIDTEDEWLGDGPKAGIIQRYMMLGSASPVMSDVSMGPDYVEAGDRHARAFVLCESSQMPTELSSIRRVDALSTTATRLFLSTGSSLGARLDCEHVVNQYVVIPPQQETHRKLERKKRDMTAGYSSTDNRLNANDIAAYLEDVHRFGTMTVFSHLNVLAWGTAAEQNTISGKITAAITAMGAIATLNRHNTPVLWYAGIPSNAFEIGTENLMTMEVHSAFAMGNYDAFDDGFGKGDIALCDRTRNKPVLVDIDEVSSQFGLNENYNKFVLGPSGAGKSFTMNRLLTCEYNADALIFGLDVGHSYEGATSLIRELTGGKDGQYHTWSKETPLSFNPFVGFTEWVDESGILNADEPGVNALISLLETSWEPEGGWSQAQEAILKQIITNFSRAMSAKGKSEEKLPLFDDFYNYINDDIRPLFDDRQAWKATYRSNLDKKKELEALILDTEALPKTKTNEAKLSKLRRQMETVDAALVETGLSVGTDFVGYEDLDLKNFHLSLKAYSLQGEFASFLNSAHPADIVRSRWTIFELDQLSNINDKTFYSLCVLQIMHAFDLKMRSIPGRKVLFVDEAWKAIANKTMAPYLRSLWKTARKFSTAAIVVTQELEDITSSEVIKNTILANSPIKILLDMRGYINTLTAERKPGDDDDIRTLLGLTPEDIPLLLSLNNANKPEYGPYKEVFIKYKQGHSMVLSVEVSPEEAIVYESNFEKKRPFLERAKKLGSYKAAIEEIAMERRSRAKR